MYLATAAVIGVFPILSVGLITGRAGIITLCQLSFTGIGAWSVAALNAAGYSLPIGLLILLGGLAAVPFGLLLGLASLRLRGINMGIVTLMFAAAAAAYFQLYPLPGLSAGKVVDRGAPFESDSAFFWLSLTVLALVVGVVSLVSRSRTGTSWLVVRTSERGAASLGLPTAVAKLTVFMVGAAVSGVGGALLIAQTGVVSGDSFGILPSIVVFTLAILFGARFIEGAILGALASVVVPQLLLAAGIPNDIGTLIFAVTALPALRTGYGMAEALRARLARRSNNNPAPDGRRESKRSISRDRSRWRQGTEPVHTDDRVLPTAVEATPALSILDLSVQYGSVRALDGVTISVPSRSVVAIVGPNGAGKSTLVDAVAGFLPGYTGEVRLNGTNLDGWQAHRRAQAGLRRTFQQVRATADLTVQQYLQLAAGRRLDRDEVDAVLDFVQGPTARSLIANVDVGSRRLIEIGGGLVSEPAVLLLDEPAAGLPSSESELLGERISLMPSVFKCSVVVIEHDMTLVHSVCDEVTVLNFGRVIATGSPKHALSDPLVVSAFLGAE
ncbi:ATP-binding cassette domain-containing protein [Galbitalea soli]|uniref:ATP-binding cassette domain-containing protein n=1 Tax=Galbitalea soli TaxID=1268042 RepID=A0A7C9TR91_9MICO|nr:ATP-binding cassette domain-containing protein [Galbitalea soli]